MNKEEEEDTTLLYPIVGASYVLVKTEEGFVRYDANDVYIPMTTFTTTTQPPNSLGLFMETPTHVFHSDEMVPFLGPVSIPYPVHYPYLRTYNSFSPLRRAACLLP